MAITQCSECGGKVSTSATACPHCGCPLEPQITCRLCGEELAASLVACPACGAPVAGGEESPVRYSPVRINKFVILSFVTFGFYPIVWFYRNWRYIKTSEGTSIWPWARALFFPLWYYQMLKRLDVQGKGLLAAALFILVVITNGPSVGLLDPDSLFDSFLILAFIILLAVLLLIPAVKAINDLNERSGTRPPSFGWRRRSAAVLVLGLLVNAMAAVGVLILVVLFSTGVTYVETPDGPYEAYYENGQLWEKGILVAGEPDGPYERYYENGQLWIMATYAAGERDGPYERYYWNGQLEAGGTYNMSERCGEWIEDGETVTYDPCPPDLEDRN